LPVYDARIVTVNSESTAGRPTIKDVARRAGVSHTTVSRVMNGGVVSAATRECVERAARDLAYEPNALARGLARRTSGVIGFLASDFSNLFIAELARAIHRVADERGYVVNMLVTDYDRDRERRALDVMVRRRVDGLIVGPPSTEADEQIRAIAERGVPVVGVARQLHHRRISEIMPRVRESTYVATTHLLELGHRKIAYIGGSPRVGYGRAKLAGYEAALADHGVPVDPDLFVESDTTVRDAYLATQLLLARDPRPTALMGVTDTIAIGAMGAIEAAGLRIPDDISVVGFDDIPFAATMHPPLTTVAQPAYELGRAAARTLFDLIDRGPQAAEAPRVWMDCAFVVRGTTGRCAPAVEADALANAAASR
jgi:DNA-binding LacI/PurR family transcriptional regulator